MGINDGHKPAGAGERNTRCETQVGGHFLMKLHSFIIPPPLSPHLPVVPVIEEGGEEAEKRLGGETCEK